MNGALMFIKIKMVRDKSMLLIPQNLKDSILKGATEAILYPVLLLN